MRNANEHTQLGAFLEIENDARVFDRLPCGLEEQPMLRIDVRRFARGYAKKVPIKLLDAIDEAAAPRDGLPGNSRLRIIKAFDVPPIWWHIVDGLAALDQEFPKRVGVIDPAGESATDSDDSNAVLRHSDYSGLGMSRSNDLRQK